MILGTHEPLAVAVTAAIREGDVEVLNRLLIDNPGLATSRIGNKTLLHVATEWPGNLPRGPETVAALVAAGADVNAWSIGSRPETPLHWAASSNDVNVLDALVDAGAHLESQGESCGTPLADAVKFGQWKTARRLLERGAQANLCQAAALGLKARLEELLASNVAPSPADISNAFWCACHGGQQTTAAYLLALGAEINWIGHDGLTPLDTAFRSQAQELAIWLIGQGAKSSKSE